MPHPIRTLSSMLLATAMALPAQQPPPAAAVPSAPGYRRLLYPRDQQFAIAEVDGQPLTLEDLAGHLEARHAPGFRTYLASDQGQLLLRSDLMAPWVRHFADITALTAEARARKLGPEQAKPALADALKRAFQGYLDEYARTRKAADPRFELSNQQVNRLLADFQLRQGLSCELQGWLDLLEPGDYSEAQLRQHFADHAREFGGLVTFAHILVTHRDAGTGLLLDDKGLGQALARLAEVKARLLPDRSNFQEVARLMSEDTRTARDGGVLRNVARFDRRLPALLTRTAWRLRDGETSDVVETEYGYHLVQRLECVQQRFLMFTPDVHPLVRQNLHETRQEDLLFESRQKHGIRLHL